MREGPGLKAMREIRERAQAMALMRIYMLATVESRGRQQRVERPRASRRANAARLFPLVTPFVTPRLFLPQSAGQARV